MIAGTANVSINCHVSLSETLSHCVRAWGINLSLGHRSCFLRQHPAVKTCNVKYKFALKRLTYIVLAIVSYLATDSRTMSLSDPLFKIAVILYPSSLTKGISQIIRFLSLRYLSFKVKHWPLTKFNLNSLL